MPSPPAPVYFCNSCFSASVYARELSPFDFTNSSILLFICACESPSVLITVFACRFPGLPPPCGAICFVSLTFFPGFGLASRGLFWPILPVLEMFFCFAVFLLLPSPFDCIILSFLTFFNGSAPSAIRIGISKPTLLPCDEATSGDSKLDGSILKVASGNIFFIKLYLLADTETLLSPTANLITPPKMLSDPISIGVIGTVFLFDNILSTCSAVLLPFSPSLLM